MSLQANRGLQYVAELVYGNLHTVVRHDAMFERLESLNDQLALFRLNLPAPELIEGLPVADPAISRGWGAVASAKDIAGFRALDW